MNILAITIPHSDRHTGNYEMLNFPLGLAYIIASIRNKIPEANVFIADFSLKAIVSDEQILGELLAIKKSFKPDYVIYGGMITRFSYIRLLSLLLRDVFPEAKQVLGGAASGSGYNYFLKDSLIDYFVVGEGEISIVDILNNNYQNNPGVLYKRNERKPEMQVIKDVNSIPFPSYQDFNILKYIEDKYRHTGWKYLPMIASRGCPFSCSFCYPSFGKAVRIRNEVLVVEEMLFLKNTYGIDSIYFCDEIQFLNKNWMERFCFLLIKERVNLKWACVSRASLFKEKDIPLLELAKKAGCLRVTIGIESGNQEILNKMDKQTTVEQIEHTLRIIRKAGIKATGSMLAGYPGETPNTIKDSVDFANRNLLNTTFYCLIPLPGSKIYEYCIENHLIDEEEKYLEKVSLSGGDASHIVINLTDMDDETYKEQIAKANKLMQKIRFNDVLRYYGFLESLRVYLVNLYIQLYKKVKGRMFETP